METAAGTGLSNLQTGVLTAVEERIHDQRHWAEPTRCIHKLSVERDCAKSQSQQYRWLALTPNLLRLVLRTQPRSWARAKFTDNLWMLWNPLAGRKFTCHSGRAEV